MATQLVDIECPNCGATVGTGQKTCEYCKQPVIISTFNSVYAMPMPMVSKYANAYRQVLAGNPDDQTINNSLAMCYLKLKLHDKALSAFEKAMEDNFDNSETFFYAAICLLGGKKAFLAQRPAIDKMQEYINAALMITPTKGIYHYLLAYIKYDYFSRKCFNTTPIWQEALAAANAAGESPSPLDIEQFWGILGVECPAVLYPFSNIPNA